MPVMRYGIFLVHLNKEIEMKIRNLIFWLSLVLIVNSCIGDNDIDNTPKLGLLKKVEEIGNGNVFSSTELSYDEDQRLIILKQFQDNHAILTYDISYINEEVNSITETYHTFDQPNETVNVVNYDVTYQNNEIILTEQNSVNKMVFEVTDGYVDSFKLYWGDNNEYINESVFKRDTNNNIDSIFNYVTDQFNTHLLIWNYTYSDFDANAKLNSAFNLVYNRSHSLYRPLIGVVLNLEISKDAPLRSSFSDGHGTYREENITATQLGYEYGLLKNISFEFVQYPENDYQLELSYY